MFICQFFNWNKNFEVTRLTQVMLRVQVNNVNDNPGTRTGSSSFFSNMHLIHVYMPIFQWESEILGYKCDKSHVEGPGEQ